MRVQYPVAAMGTFARESQLCAVAIEFSAPLDKLLDPLRAFLDQDLYRFNIAQTIACAECILKMKTNFILITERRGYAALSQLRGRVLHLTLCQDHDAPGLRQLNGGPQAGNSSADHKEIGFGWRALHKRKCYHACDMQGSAHDTL